MEASAISRFLPSIEESGGVLWLPCTFCNPMFSSSVILFFLGFLGFSYVYLGNFVWFSTLMLSCYSYVAHCCRSLLRKYGLLRPLLHFPSIDYCPYLPLFLSSVTKDRKGKVVITVLEESPPSYVHYRRPDFMFFKYLFVCRTTWLRVGKCMHGQVCFNCFETKCAWMFKFSSVDFTEACVMHK